jgi:glucokinase
LANEIEKATALPTIIENDANCAGLGEVWLGAGRSFQNLILLTLGTGVGGAIFIQGELWTGSYGAAGELGLITLDRDGPTCRSGNRGSLEQFASIGGIYRRTGQDPAILGELAAQGDRQALSFWEDYGRGLGAGLASLLYVLTPEAVIFGGGISSSAQFFLPAVEAEIKQRVLPTSREGLQLLSAELGNQAGMTGAARLAWQQIGINKLRINEK